MHFGWRVSFLMLAIFALLAVSSATHPEGIFLKRQNSVGGTGVSATPSRTPNPSSSVPSSSRPPDSSSASPTPSAAPSSPVSSPAVFSTPSAAPSTRAPSSATSSNKPEPSTFTSALVTSEVQQTVITYVTVSNGQTLSSLITSSRVVAITTGMVTYTSTPNLNNGNGSGGSSGLSSSSKKIIAGVVGGVGGAILLGGIALVAWRVWGRKRQNPDEDDDIMSGGTDSLHREKHASAGGNTPFQTTLDQYHSPGRPNPSANF